MNGTPYGRKRRAQNHFHQSFKAPVREQKPQSEREFQQAESMFYEHAKRDTRRTGVVKVIK